MFNSFVEYNPYHESFDYEEELKERQEYEDWQGNNQYDIMREERD